MDDKPAWLSLLVKARGSSAVSALFRAASLTQKVCDIAAMRGDAVVSSCPTPSYQLRETLKS